MQRRSSAAKNKQVTLLKTQVGKVNILKRSKYINKINFNKQMYFLFEIKKKKGLDLTLDSEVRSRDRAAVIAGGGQVSITRW